MDHETIRRPKRWTQVIKATTPLATLADLYLTTCRTEGKTAKTLRGYAEKLGRYVRWLDGDLSDFTLVSVRAYLAMRQQEPKWRGHPTIPQTNARLSLTTVGNDVRVLKGFSTWLSEEGYTNENRLVRLVPPKAPRKVMDVLSEPEIAALLGTFDVDTANGCRDLAIVTLFLDAGLRCAELVSLKLVDLHLEEQWLKVMGKGQKERIIPFGSRATKILLRYTTFFRPRTLPVTELFLTDDGSPITENTIKMLFARLRVRTGIGRLHAHLLRHTCATRYLISGGDVFTLQHILGHTTLEMTRRYVALASAHVTIQQHRFSPIDTLQLPGFRVTREAAEPSLPLFRRRKASAR
jgi:site-specific recombinase XerD